ncbi:hypothetical protein [Immundisolibacter cernigliae]|uniref:Uncharacterized protein n=1 Tax=Immundisolibacter cernigliae TaxID=1810504 RepID=A0A1B1YW96_9GAMM|nr:hypothetical protein [Immundisolibacter cernigliae]ANX05105.1 hypothetical protein PG2T_13570 [Immundisolibacter cernigliae]
MATLLEQLGSLASGGSVSVDIAGAAGRFADIGATLRGVMTQPPGDFAALLGHLDALPLPKLELAADLTAGLGTLLPQLQGALAGGAQPLSGALSGLGANVQSGLADALGPLLAVVEAVRTLLATDLSCGLIPAFASPPVAAPVPTPAPGDPPAPPAAPVPAPAPVFSAAQVDTAKALLDTLPADMSAPALLGWLHHRIGVADGAGYFGVRAIPLLDDLRDPLDSLMRWDAATGAQLMDEFSATLSALASIVTANSAAQPAVSIPSDTVSELPGAPIGNAAQQLMDALGVLDAAVRADDAAAIAAALGTGQAAQAVLEAQNALFDAQQAAVAALRGAVLALPGRLETGICRLLVLLAPRAAVGGISAAFVPTVPASIGADAFQPVADLLTRVRQWLERLLGALDVGAVTAPLAAVFGQAQDAIQTVEQGIAQLTATARAAFGEADAALSAFDPAAIVAQARAAIEQAVQALADAIGAALGPAGAALTQAITAAGGALDAFDSEALAAPVQALLDELSALLQGPQVQALIDALAQLQALAQQLDALSFAPVADAVIGGIGEVKSALDAIDDAKLVAPMPEMISTAMSVLPPSLVPIINPLLGELDDLVAQSPGPLLDSLRELPQRIAGALAAYSPRALLDEPLGTPFTALTGELDGFSPTAWLDGAHDALDGALGRLAAALEPAPLLAPLTQAHGALTRELAALRPGQLLEPLAAQVEAALATLDGALPTQDLAQALAQVATQVQRLLEPFNQATDVIAAWTAKLALLADPDAQLSAWLDAILAKLPADAPVQLAGPLGALATAVENARAAALQSAWTRARAPLDAALAAADAPARLARLVQAKNALTAPRVAAVSDAAQRAALTAFLAGVDPLGPLGRGLAGLSRLSEAVTRSNTALTALFADWDARYLRLDGPLAGLAPAALTAEALRALLREAIDQQIGAPVVGFLKALKSISALISTFGDALGDLLEAIQSKLAALFAAPQALADAAQALDALVERITGLDLDVYTREVDALHGALVDKLRALDPAALGTVLRGAVQDLLDDITLGAVFTPALRAQLDAAWAQLRARLAALDPGPLVIEPLQAVYERDLLPVAQAFDVGDAMQAVLDKLGALPDELRTELNRVDVAYQAMLAAAPSSSPAGESAAVAF